MWGIAGTRGKWGRLASERTGSRPPRAVSRFTWTEPAGVCLAPVPPLSPPAGLSPKLPPVSVPALIRASRCPASPVEVSGPRAHPRSAPDAGEDNAALSTQGTHACAPPANILARTCSAKFAWEAQVHAVSGHVFVGLAPQLGRTSGPESYCNPPTQLFPECGPGRRPQHLLKRSRDENSHTAGAQSAGSWGQSSRHRWRAYKQGTVLRPAPRPQGSYRCGVWRGDPLPGSGTAVFSLGPPHMLGGARGLSRVSFMRTRAYHGGTNVVHWSSPRHPIS